MKRQEIINILNVVQTCLDFAKRSRDMRAVVRKQASEYEPCLNGALSQQMEMISGLMVSCGLLVERMEDIPYREFGKEPLSPEDAILFLDDFLDIAQSAVSDALASDEEPLSFPSVSLGVRAMTFACLLRKTKDDLS